MKTGGPSRPRGWSSVDPLSLCAATWDLSKWTWTGQTCVHHMACPWTKCSHWDVPWIQCSCGCTCRICQTQDGTKRQRNCQQIQEAGIKSLWEFLRKLNIELPYGPAPPFLGMDPKERETGTQDACTLMFIAVSSMITGRCKQPKYISVDERMKKKAACPQDRVVFGYKKRWSTQLTHGRTSETLCSRTEKTTYCIIPFI